MWFRDYLCLYFAGVYACSCSCVCMCDQLPMKYVAMECCTCGACSVCVCMCSACPVCVHECVMFLCVFLTLCVCVCACVNS